MRYIFLDETYPCQGTTKIQEATKNIVMAGWTVEQHRFNLNAHRLPELFRTPVLDQIASLFQTLDARALIGKATLDSILFRPGEIDATDDIAAMARTDNVWSHCMIFLISTLILELVGGGHEISLIDIYYDPKNLKLDHTEALRATLQTLVVREARRFASERNSEVLTKLRIRGFQPVTKPRHGHVPTKFQMGTWVADKLLAIRCFGRKQELTTDSPA